jgi:ribosomal protein S7
VREGKKRRQKQAISSLAQSVLQSAKEERASERKKSETERN